MKKFKLREGVIAKADCYSLRYRIESSLWRFASKQALTHPKREQHVRKQFVKGRVDTVYFLILDHLREKFKK